jgi:dephospho-CoA kinase
MKIIGIAGLPRSGKDTLAEYLMANGYFGVSLGDIVREKSRVRHADDPDPISIANMTETANWLRQDKGADFALQEALKRFDAIKGKHKGLVVYSVRAPVEVDFILSHGGELVWVEASDEIRYERWIQHLRKGEPKISVEEFKRQEALQWQPQPNIPPEIQMNIAYVKSKATKMLFNNGNDIENFKDQAAKLFD